MAYRIDYQKKSARSRDKLYWVLGGLCILLCILLQKPVLVRTAPALETMAASFKAGVPLEKAVEAFCRDLFDEKNPD